MSEELEGELNGGYCSTGRLVFTDTPVFFQGKPLLDGKLEIFVPSGRYLLKDERGIYCLQKEGVCVAPFPSKISDEELRAYNSFSSWLSEIQKSSGDFKVPEYYHKSLLSSKQVKLNSVDENGRIKIVVNKDRTHVRDTFRNLVISGSWELNENARCALLLFFTQHNISVPLRWLCAFFEHGTVTAENIPILLSSRFLDDLKYKIHPPFCYADCESIETYSYLLCLEYVMRVPLAKFDLNYFMELFRRRDHNSRVYKYDVLSIISTEVGQTLGDKICILSQIDDTVIPLFLVFFERPDEVIDAIARYHLSLDDGSVLK